MNATIKPRDAAIATMALCCIIVLSTQTLGQTMSVITTQPDLADVALAIGGDTITVKSLTRGHEDLHLVRVLPSTLVKVKRADLFLELGLDAEHAWVPELIRTARNPKVSPGNNGFLNCSAGISVLRVPSTRGRGEGPDIHPRGNPHYNLDPERMRQVARTIRDRLKRVSPAQANRFDSGCAAWEKSLDEHMARWRARLAPFHGAGFVEHHDAWIYFAERFHLRIVARLEPKPGMQPTAGHLADVIQTSRSQNVRLVIARSGSQDVAEKVAREIDGTAKLLTLSSTQEPSGTGYFAFMDDVVETFARHLKGS